MTDNKNKNGETPRTDAKAFRAVRTPAISVGLFEAVMAEDCRQIERELNAEIAIRTIANGEINKLNARIRLLDDAIHRSLEKEKAYVCELNAATAENAQLAKEVRQNQLVDEEILRLKDRIKRLEEAGQNLWKKAHAVSCREVWSNANGDEIPVESLPAQTVVYDTDFGDGITAVQIASVNFALDRWKLTKESK